MRIRKSTLGKSTSRNRKIRRPELLEPRQLLAADPIVVNLAFDSNHFENDGQAITLREALEMAKANPGHDTITFAPNLKFSTLLPTSELVVDSDVTIDATSAGLLRVGREVGSSSGHRIFNVTGLATVEMKNIIVQGGEAANGGFGAGILNNGNLTLINSVVGGNTQTRRDTGTATSPRYLLGGGAGIYNGPSAVLELDNTHIGAMSIDTTDFTDLQADGDLGRTFELVPNNQAELGSGILNRGRLVVKNNSSIAYNRANYHGAGIYNTGLASIFDSSVVGNRIDNGLGDAHGGGIANSNRRPSAINPASRVYTYVTKDSFASLTIERSEIKNNFGGWGGGVFSEQSAFLTVRDSEVAGNKASQEGGGIYSSPTNSVIPVTNIYHSLFVGNESPRNGAAIAHTREEMFIDASTFTENSGSTAIYSVSDIEVSSSTITRNGSGGVLIQTGNLKGNLELYNSIVADNGSNNAFSNDLSFSFPNTTSYLSRGYNLLGSVFINNGTVTHHATDRLSISDPGLGPLGEYGGHTRSISLLPNSPALNSGPSSFSTNARDQRGEPRIIGPQADRGAFESKPLQSMEVDSISGILDGYYDPGQVTLADAVAWANEIPGHDTITFSDQLVERIQNELDGSTTVSLQSQINVTDDLTIRGPGANVLGYSGRDTHRVFEVSRGIRLDVRDLTLTNGRSSSGGAIRNNGSLSLTGVEVKDSVSTDLGGGVWSGAGTTLVMNNSTVAGNQAERGGGLYFSGTTNISNSTIADNSSSLRGGGFLTAISPNISIDATTITGNNGGASGGGFRAEGSAVVQLSNTVVAGNLATSDPDYSDASDAVSLGFNLIGDIGGASSPLRSFTHPSDQLGGGSHDGAIPPIDPLLGPLRYLGGPTRSVGILPTSPLIDAADPTSVITKDQRGISRPHGERNDIGAFEYIPPAIVAGAPITVDSLDSIADGYFAAGELSLTEAVLFASELDGPNTIEFAGSLFVDEEGRSVAAEITIDRTLTISDELNIVGPGHHLLIVGIGDNENAFSIHEAGVATISGLTIDGEGQGRAIENDGDLSLSSVYVINGNANQGAALFNTGTANVHQSTFAHHQSLTFFGEEVSEELFGGAIHNTGSFAATNSTFSSNEGGAIWNTGTARLQQSTVAHNDTGVGNLGAARLQSTIVADNDSNIVNLASVDLIVSEGHNLLGSAGWSDTVELLGANFVDTNIVGAAQRDIGLYDESTHGGISYEFIYSAPNSATSSALMGSSDGPTAGESAALKLEQWQNTGNYGVTQYGFTDHDSRVRQIVDQRTHVVFVADGNDMDLYVNGQFRTTMSGASVNLSGLAGIGHTFVHATGESRDALNGTVHGVAVYDRALSAGEISTSYNATFYTPLNLQDTDVVDFKPKLTELVSISGSIPMHGLLPSSPAIDAGGNAGEAVDQRGQTRPLQNAYDIGAFEAKELFWTDELVVTDLSDRLDAEYEEGLSLREAALWANRKDATNLEADTRDVITFHPDLVAEMVANWENDGQATTIELREYQNPDLIISAPLEISPFRHEDPITLPDDQLLQITTNGTHRIFTVLDSAISVLIEDLTAFGGGDISSGGGIFTASDLELHNVVVRDNSSSSRGGGIVVDGDATLRLDHAIVNSNSSPTGGGIYAAANTSTDIAYSSIEKNVATATADTNGGGLWSQGQVVVMSSTFAENQGGWAIYAVGSGDILDLDNTTISANKNGGIFAHAANIQNSTVYGNSGEALRTNDARNTTFYNSISHLNGTDSMVGIRTNGSIVDPTTDPMLLPLAFYGGPTRTHALNPESPAIDAGDPNFAPILDQRGRPMVDIPTIEGSGPGNIVDIGAYEVQSVVNSDWTYSARSRSQFGEGTATVFGFGFDDGLDGRSVSPDPVFLGIPFDTGPLTLGGIGDVLGAKFGGEVRADFAGRLGFDLGLYVNAGTVDVDYGGMLNYVIDEDPDTGVIDVATFFDVEAGSLYTVSPKVGAYMDLVVELDANIGASGCLFGCVGFDVPFKVDQTMEMFAINRQKTDKEGEKFFDGEIRIGGGSLWTPSIGETVGEDELRERQATERLTDANRRIAESENELQRITDEEDALKKATGQGAVSGGALDQRREAALDSRAKAQTDKADFENDVRDSNPAKNGKRQVGKKQPDIKTGLQVSFSEASGSLLGVQGTLAAVAEVDLANVDPVIEAGFSKEIGSVAVTVPDINLQDRTPDSRGKLSATTDNFEKNSDEEAKRQLAKLQVDAGGLLGPMLGIPAGKYSASLGPLSLSAQLISYNIGPQLNVTQDVDAQWYAKRVSFLLDKPASVRIDNGALELIDQEDNFIFSFQPGQDVKITPVGDEPITVTPSLTMDVKFENDFGLDIDLEGALEALSLQLKVGSESLIDIKPLISEKHNLGTLDLGSIFSRNWDLLEKVETMPSFQIGGQAQDGKTAASALMGEVDATNERVSAVEVEGVDSNTIVFLAKEAVTHDEAGAFFHSEVRYEVDSNQIKSIYVLHDGLTVEAFYESGSSQEFPATMGRELNLSLNASQSEYPTSLRVSGFSTETLDESSRVVVALKFANAETPVTVNMTLGDEAELLPNVGEGDSGNIGRLSQTSLDNLITTAVVGFDVDGDGMESPLTDGVLLMRYMDQPTTPDSREDAIGKDATRNATEIWEYIDETLDRIELPDAGGSYRTLDIDGDGNVWAKTDGVLISRFLAGFNGTVLTAGALGEGATRTNAAELRDFLRFGRVTTNDAEVELRDENDNLIVSRGTGFGEVLQFNNSDLFNVDDSLDASGADPGTASGNAVDGSTVAVRGASAESAASPRSSKSTRAGDLQVFQFELSNYRQTVKYDEIYLVNEADEELDTSTHDLVSRVAKGAPANFANTKYESLTTNDVETKLRRNVSASVLGVDEPIFVQAPDAAGYTYSTVTSEDVTAAFLFREVVIDTQVGDNGYLSGGFDLYLPVSDDDGNIARWEFVTFIEAGNSLFDSGNGILRYEFDAPVETFRLFPTALPSVDIHQEENLAAPDLVTTTGFTLIPTNGTSSIPKIEMTQIAHREAPNDSPTVTLPVHIETGTTGTAFANHIYNIVRAENSESATVTGRRAYAAWGATSQTVQLASANQIRISGSDSASDTLEINFSQGPIHTPIEFDGGSRTDTVRFVGADVHLDLTQNHQFTNVEIFDIGGTGSNSLRLDIDVLKSIGPTDNTFTIIGTDAVNDMGVDHLAIGGGWELVGTRPGPQFTRFDIYQQDGIILDISAGIELDRAATQTPLSPSGKSILNQSVTVVEQPAQTAPIVNIVKSKTSTPTRTGNSRSITSLETTFSTSLLTPMESTELTASANVGSSSTGFQFRVHYDSSQIDLQRTPDRTPIINLTHVLADQLSGVQVSTDCVVTQDEEGNQEEYCNGIDRDQQTDSYVNFLWLDPSGEWLANQTTVADLLSLIFVAQDSFSETTVRFTGDLSGGVELEPSSERLETRIPVEGDLNQDSLSNSQDIDYLFAAIRDESTDERLDVNHDSSVNQQDVDYLLSEAFNTRRGDANLDGTIGFADFLALSANFGKTDEATWQEGDFDGDGEIGFADFLLLSTNFGK